MAGQMVHFEIWAVTPPRRRSSGRALRLAVPGVSRCAQRVPHDAVLRDDRRGAIYGADGDKRGTRTYFDVDDINAGAGVNDLGGDAGEAPPVPAGLVRGRQDVQGNEFGLRQIDPDASM